MSNPTVTPPVTPRPRRSMTGPFVLIVIGVVFLLGNLRVLSWAGLGSLFAHYWPVLLILWGTIKLIEYKQAQRDNRPAPGIGAGGVFLLVILIMAGIISTHVARVHWAELRDEMDIGDNDFPWMGSAYNFEDQLSQAVPSGANVKIVNDRGAVNVSASADEQIHVSVRKKIRADDEKQANEWNTSTKPQVNVSGNLVTINANTLGAGDHPVSTDLDVSIPRKGSLTIASKRGDVSVIGRDGSVDISNQRGDVAVEDVGGSVNLNLDRSSARISNIAGDVSIDGRSNEVSLSDVKGFARLNGEFMESLKLSKIGKTVSFKSARTDMEFAKLDGDLDLDQGDLRASNLAGPLRLITRSKDINLDGVTGEARVKNENGSVALQMASSGNVQIDNRQGDIKIEVPEKLGFKVDARARGGEIQSDFDALKVDNGDDNGTATGSVGNGMSHLVLNNEHGTIEIRKWSGVAQPAAVPSPPHPPKPPKPPKEPAGEMQPTEN